MKNIDLARIMMDKIKDVPDLVKYIEVTEGADDLEAMPLANLFVHLDEYYNQATTIKSALLFLTEDVGINQRHCILLLAIEDKEFCKVVASIVGQTTENYYVARAHTIEDANKILTFFNLNEWNCGLIIEDRFCDEPCDPFLEKCESPACVLIEKEPTYRYMKLLSLGASTIVNRDTDDVTFEKRMETALIDMFMEEM